MTEDEYNKLPGVRSSYLKKAADESLLHYKHSIENENKESKAMTFGLAIHSRLLTPHNYNKEVVVSPVFKGKGSVAAKKEFGDNNAGMIIINDEEADAVKLIEERYHDDPAVTEMMSRVDSNNEIRYEETVQWTCPITGLKCKSRNDMIAPGAFIGDIKTTRHIKPHTFHRDARWMFRYDISAAFYLEGARIEFESEHDYYFIAIENEAPYDIVVYQPSPEFIAQGEADMIDGLEKLAEAELTGKYPGYGGGQIQKLG